MFLLCIVILFLYPLLFVLSASVSDPLKVLGGELWLFPKGITFDSYRRIFQNNDIITGYRNTIMYTAVGTAINLIMTTLAAYPLSRKELSGKTAIIILFTVTMYFHGGLIPTYLVIKQLSLLNTFWVMVIPNAVAMFNVFVMISFFKSTIPEEIHEAATIDGCSHFKILYSIVLPLSYPIMAVMVLFYGVAHWNAYFNALIYLSSREMFPLQLIMREILVQNEMSSMMEVGMETVAHQALLAESIKYALIVVSSLPFLLLYPFLQRYFVKGVLLGAIKG